MRSAERLRVGQLRMLAADAASLAPAQDIIATITTPQIVSNVFPIA
jgi:hypothetical protein